MPLGDSPYATVEEFKPRINMALTETDDDEMIQQLINTASYMVDHVTRKPPEGKWAFKEYTGETRRYDDTRTGLLPIDDCLSITSVTRQGTTQVEDTDYYPEPDTTLPITKLIFWRGGPGHDPLKAWEARRGITIVGNWGYCADADIPPVVKDAVLTQAEKLYERMHLDPTALMQAMTDPWRSLDRAVAAMLAPLIRRSV